MFMDTSSEKPIYIQLAEWMMDAVLSGAFPEESQVPSTTEISVNYRINPATALKGVNVLVDEAILYKKRGLGMFVSSGAKSRILAKRKKDFFDSYITALIAEANKLGIGQGDVIAMIERGYVISP
jgi:DNA-binding transcriptional regulator YhcF (GntR family)